MAVLERRLVVGMRFFQRGHGLVVRLLQRLAFSCVLSARFVRRGLHSGKCLSMLGSLGLHRSSVRRTERVYSLCFLGVRSRQRVSMLVAQRLQCFLVLVFQDVDGRRLSLPCLLVLGTQRRQFLSMLGLQRLDSAHMHSSELALVLLPRRRRFLLCGGYRVDIGHDHGIDHGRLHSVATRRQFCA